MRQRSRIKELQIDVLKQEQCAEGKGYGVERVIAYLSAVVAQRAALLNGLCSTELGLAVPSHGQLHAFDFQ